MSFQYRSRSEETESCPRVYMVLPATDFSSIEKWSNRIVVVLGVIICILIFVFLTWGTLTDWDAGPFTIQHPENLRGGNPNSQVIGDHLGGLDRLDVRVGEERGAGELQP